MALLPSPIWRKKLEKVNFEKHLLRKKFEVRDMRVLFFELFTEILPLLPHR
jgi:hypothetical protein